MKRVIERFLLLPFSIAIGCHSQSSVAISTTANSQSKSREKGTVEESKFKTNKNRVLEFPHGLMSCLKSLFVYKEERDGMTDKELEIGYPTDVKHVTHIGLDGSVVKWDNLIKSTDHIHQSLSFPSISVQQFELAMAAQSHRNPLI